MPTAAPTIRGRTGADDYPFAQAGARWVARADAVRVLADRGIGTSPLLMRGIAALGWTFLFRVTKQSKIILPTGEAVTFYDQVTAPGQTYAASGRVFKKRGRIPAHVRVLWGQALVSAGLWSPMTRVDRLGICPTDVD